MSLCGSKVNHVDRGYPSLPVRSRYTKQSLVSVDKASLSLLFTKRARWPTLGASKDLAG